MGRHSRDQSLSYLLAELENSNPQRIFPASGFLGKTYALSPLGDFDQWRDGVEGIGHPREERVLVIPGKGRERVELGGRV